MNAKEFDNFLKPNFIVHETKPDGNCFYRAFARGRFGNQEGQVYVRQRAIMYIQNHPEVFANVLRDGELELHQRDAEWADDITIYATALAYNVNIVIVRSPELGNVIRGPERGANGTVYVSYNQNHYNGLEPRMHSDENLSENVSVQSSQNCKAGSENSAPNPPSSPVSINQTAAQTNGDEESVCNVKPECKGSEELVPMVELDEFGLKMFKCPLCSYICARMRLFIQHKSKHSNERPFKCPDCALDYKTSNALYRHRVTKHGFKSPTSKSSKQDAKESSIGNSDKIERGNKGCFICPVCGIERSYKSSLTLHIQEEHEKKSYKCSICSEEFPTYSRFRSHMRQHKKRNELPDEASEHNNHEDSKQPETQDLPKKDQLDDEKNGIEPEIVTNKSGGKLFKCPTCKKVFPRKDTCRIHIQTVHNNNQPFNCKTCGSDFETKLELQQHIKLCHLHQGTRKCEICTKEIDSKNFFIHKKYHVLQKTRGKEMDILRLLEEADEDKVDDNIRNENSKVTKQPAPLIVSSYSSDADAEAFKIHVKKVIIEGLTFYACSECGVVYIEKHRCEAHIMKHLGQKPLKCSECNKGFSVDYLLNLHVRRCHNPNRPKFSCNECGRHLVSKKNLMRHQRLQHGNGIPCNKCGEKFKTCKEYILHRKMHMIPKYWKCEDCMEKFQKPYELKVHGRLHKGLLPFRCKICFKQFASLESLRGHFRVHKIKESFKCPFCGIVFQIQRNYRRHIKHVHIKISKRKCKICSRVLYSAVTYRVHMNAVHKKAFRCKRCKFVSSTPKRLAMHRIKMHKDEIKHRSSPMYRCSCRDTFTCRHTAQFHRICWNAVDPTKHILGPDDETRVYNLKTDTVKVQGDAEIDFFIENYRQSANAPLVCCGYLFMSKTTLRTHLLYYHQTTRDQVITRQQQDAIRSNYSTEDDAVDALVKLVYMPSLGLFQTHDIIRKVYVLAIVPVTIDQNGLADFLTNEHSLYKLYIGKKSGLGTKIASHHQCLSAVYPVCTNIYASIEKDSHCFHIVDIFLTDLNNVAGIDAIRHHEAMLILKLYIFCKIYNKDFMFQKLEVGSLKRDLTKSEFALMIDQIMSCRGNIMQLLGGIHFVKSMQLKTNNVTSAMRKSLICTKCHQQQNSLYGLNNHKFIKHNDDSVPIWTKMTAKSVAKYQIIKHALEQTGHDTNHYVYAVAAFEKEIKGSIKIHVSDLNNHVTLYIGKRSSTGDWPSDYHNDTKVLSSTIKKTKLTMPFAYHVCNWNVNNSDELEKAERMLIIIGLLRNHQINGQNLRITLTNSIVNLWDIGQIFTMDEFTEVVKYAFSSRDIFSDPPSFFGNTTFFRRRRV